MPRSQNLELRFSQATRTAPYRLRSRNVPMTNIQVAADKIQQFRESKGRAVVYPFDSTKVHPRLSLLGLPGELRNMVYQHVFDGTAEGTEELNILRTCRQVYHEAVTAAMDNATFDISHLWRNDIHCRWDIREALHKVLPLVRQKSIKNIKMVLVSYFSLDLAKMMSLSPQLQKLVIEITSANEFGWENMWIDILRGYGSDSDWHPWSSWDTNRDEEMKRVMDARGGKFLPVCEMLVHQTVPLRKSFYRRMKRVVPNMVLQSSKGNGFKAVFGFKRGEVIFRALPME